MFVIGSVEFDCEPALVTAVEVEAFASYSADRVSVHAATRTPADTRNNKGLTKDEISQGPKGW